MAKDKNSLDIPFMVILFYALPVLFFSVYSIGLMSEERSWFVLSIGLFLLAFCSITLISIVRRLEIEKNSTTVTFTKDLNPSLSSNLSTQKSLENTSSHSLKNDEPSLFSQTEEKDQQILYLNRERAHLEQQLQQSLRELNICQDNIQSEAKRKQLLCAEYDKTIQEQRELLESKQQQIIKLENTVHDLSHEIETLVQISDYAHHATKQSSSLRPPFIQVNQEKCTSLQMEHGAPELLKRYVTIAQKLTGANHFGSGESRFSDFMVNGYALELRRLCDSLCDEKTGIILLYSQKEDKLLFANNHTKELLGWGADKFVQDFHSLIQDSSADWKHALAQLMSRNETHLHMQIKTKMGSSIPMQCHLAIIPTGIFKGHIIGIILEVASV